MPVKHRQAEIAVALLELLPTEPPGLPLAEARRLVQERVPPNSSEVAANNYLGGWTDGLKKAGWLVKSSGRWWTNLDGRAAAAAFRNDPEGFYQDWNRRYHAALGREPQELRQRSRLGQLYIPHPERERQLASAVEIARLVLNAPDLYEPQRRKVLTEVLWFATQVDGKYSGRFRSNAARGLAASERKQLRHDHVLTRKELIDALLREPDRVDEIVRSVWGA